MAPALAFLLTLMVALILLSGGGGGDRGGVSRTAQIPAKARIQHPTRELVAHRAPHALPSAVSGEAVVAQPGGVLVIGGLDSSDVSTTRVFELNSATGRSASAGSLSEPRHDAAAAALAGRVLVFAGGSATELDSVESLRGGGAGLVLGRLPTTRSDLSALTIDGRAYLLGGYDGRAPTGVVLRTTDGHRFTAIATLRVAFRYAAVAAVGRTIYAFGGELSNGLDSDAIQELDTSTDRVRVVGRLPRPLSHASAVTLGGQIYILGGRTRETPTDRILSFDPSTKRVGAAGRLPLAVTNAAAATVGGIGYLIGGLDANGASLATVVDVRLASRGR